MITNDESASVDVREEVPQWLLHKIQNPFFLHLHTMEIYLTTLFFPSFRRLRIQEVLLLWSQLF